MGFVKEFKEFAIKGNALDLAIGVIIGGAFGKIINSIVADLIMPVVSAIIGSPDFSNLYIALKGVVPKTHRWSRLVQLRILSFLLMVISLR